MARDMTMNIDIRARVSRVDVVHVDIMEGWKMKSQIDRHGDCSMR